MASHKRKRPEVHLGSGDSKKARSEEDTNAPAALPPISNYLTIVYGGSQWHARKLFQNIVVFGDSYSKSNESDTWSTISNDESAKIALQQDQRSKNAHIGSDNTIYFVFFGINDCGTTEQDELETIVENIFDTLHDLYVKSGARNFVLFDVPPIDRSPQAITSEATEVMQDRIKSWNESLHTHASEFGLSSKKANVFLFSAHQTLTDVLDDPLEYDFSDDDPVDECGGIWADDLHLTSEVHDVVAETVVKALLG